MTSRFKSFANYPIFGLVLVLYLQSSVLKSLACDISNEGFDSDCLTVQLKPTRLPLKSPYLYQDYNPRNFSLSQNYRGYSGPLGLFSVVASSIGDILCELRGDLIPTSDSFPFDAIPIVIGPDQREYVLQGNTICTMVNDCFDPSLSKNFEGCNYNARFEYTFGKIVLKATTTIDPDEVVAFINF